MRLLSCCDAGVLREAVGSLNIGYCARLLSCCDAGVLRKGLLAYWVLGAAIAAELLGSDLPLKQLDIGCC